MDGQRRVAIGLELEVADDQISGDLLDPAGCRRTFSGWLELLAALHEISSTGGFQKSPMDGGATG